MKKKTTVKKTKAKKTKSNTLKKVEELLEQLKKEKATFVFLHASEVNNEIGIHGISNGKVSLLSVLSHNLQYRIMNKVTHNDDLSAAMSAMGF